jgi:hypothetical protein
MSGPVSVPSRSLQAIADAGRSTAIDGVQDVEARAPLPTVYGNGVVADVDRHDEPIAEGRRIPIERPVVGERCGADHHAQGSHAEKRLGVRARPDASCCLDGHRRNRGHDVADELRVDPTGARGTEVDEMDELRAARSELARERQRIGPPRHDLVERAALEPNGVPLEHVDGGDDQESIVSN